MFWGRIENGVCGLRDLREIFFFYKKFLLKAAVYYDVYAYYKITF